ncbi:MAG TPA: hypothetical protein VHM02_05410, partial [Thermoanaerobaculia bacterium]|nr:hypothetical protein [Thermoanaerobaculia bacterium]
MVIVTGRPSSKSSKSSLVNPVTGSPRRSVTTTSTLTTSTDRLSKKISPAVPSPLVAAAPSPFVSGAADGGGVGAVC